MCFGPHKTLQKLLQDKSGAENDAGLKRPPQFVHFWQIGWRITTQRE